LGAVPGVAPSPVNSSRLAAGEAARPKRAPDRHPDKSGCVCAPSYLMLAVPAHATQPFQPNLPLDFAARPDGQ